MKPRCHRVGPEGMAEARKGRAMDVLLPRRVAATAAVSLARLRCHLQSALRLHAAAHVQQRLLWLKRQAGTFGFADMLQRLDAALRSDNGPACAAASWPSTRWR